MPSILTSNGTVRIMYLLIQPDLERKSKVKEEIEKYSIIRTVTAVERADVVIIVIDAVEGVTEQKDLRLQNCSRKQQGIILQ